jgi:hypothetical protein
MLKNIIWSQINLFYYEAASMNRNLFNTTNIQEFYYTALLLKWDEIIRVLKTMNDSSKNSETMGVGFRCKGKSTQYERRQVP